MAGVLTWYIRLSTTCKCSFRPVLLISLIFFLPMISQGQFTRFQRVFHMMPYRLLLHHKECTYLSSLQVMVHHLVYPDMPCHLGLTLLKHGLLNASLILLLVGR